jgi:hypothetical protein
VRADRSTTLGTYELTWQADGGIAVARIAPTDSTVGTFAPGSPVRFAGVELIPGPHRPGAPDAVKVAVLPFGEAARRNAPRIAVERTSRDANVVQIRFDHTDPRVAEDAVRAAVSGFIALRDTLFKRESGETVDSLRGVSERTRAELTAAEATLVAQQTRTGLIAADVQTEAGVERLVEAEVELETARQELEAIVTMLARAEASPEAASAWTTLVSHPRFFENETMGSLLTRLTELEGERVALAARRSEQSLEYRTLVEQMGYLDASLRSVAASYRTALGERIGALQGIVDDLRGQLAAVPAQALDLARQQRELRLLGEVYVLTEQRLRQEELRQALIFSNVQVIDEPELQYRPIWPRKKLGLAVGLMLAMGCAVLAMVVVESADATARKASELVSLTGAPVLAALGLGEEPALGVGSGSALLRLGGLGGEIAPPPLVIAAVDERQGRAVADHVRTALVAGSSSTSRDVRVSPPVTSYPAALEALALGGPVLLAVVHGRTTLPDIERAARLLRDAGGSVTGLIVLVRSEEEAVELWA